MPVEHQSRVLRIAPGQESEDVVAALLHFLKIHFHPDSPELGRVQLSDLALLSSGTVNVHEIQRVLHQLGSVDFGNFAIRGQLLARRGFPLLVLKSQARILVRKLFVITPRTTSVQGPVVWDIHDGVLTLELNRVREMNILDVPTRKRILQVLRRHDKDSAVKCAVIAARGDVFSAGADLKFLLGLRGGRAKSYAKFVREFLAYVENYPKPTIGVVSGLAVGGGVELLMALDIIIATPEARFGQTELKVGLIPGGGGTQRLPRSVGMRKAKEMVFTGGLISAEEAYDWGLVNRVVPKDTLLQETTKLCEKLKSMNPTNLELVKELMKRGSNMNLANALQMESDAYSAVLSSPEAKAAIRAFLKGTNHRKWRKKS